MGFQRIDIVRPRVTDRRIAAAFAMARGQHVPDPDPVRRHTLEPRVVRELVQPVLAEHRAGQPPERVDILSGLTPLSITQHAAATHAFRFDVSCFVVTSPKPANVGFSHTCSTTRDP
ncbi:hypothetical protein G3N64_12210 [Burkholderia sp. Ac-20344]|nr:hypothetical protein [Burkholderia sp. Ac-20344]